MRAWWRRNIWGLLALPLLLVGLGLPYISDLYGRYIANVPSTAIEAPLGDSAEYAGGTIRLVDVARVTPIVTATGKPLELPPGFAVIRAELAFTTPAGFEACAFTLEDQRGRRFTDGPSELEDTNLSSFLCLDFKDDPSLRSGQVYFVIPADATPVAVRVVVASQLPRYVRLLTG